MAASSSFSRIGEYPFLSDLLQNSNSHKEGDLSSQLFAVLGSPIAHSLSPVLHNAAFRALGLNKYTYGRVQVEEHNFDAFIEEFGALFRGFSVTMPLKFKALALAGDAATRRARLMGSANTLIRQPDGSWLADNTDTLGVLAALDQVWQQPENPHQAPAVVVGAGGTARPALWALAQRGISKVIMVNRSDRSAEFTELAAALDLSLEWQSPDALDLEAPAVIISTIPAAAAEPLAIQLAEKHAEQQPEKQALAPLVDVIYHPRPTPLIRAVRAAGFPAVDGLVMLAHQAFAQAEQFTGQPAPEAAMLAALEAAVAEPGE